MYDPKVNDYVQWENGKGIEGWVYFKAKHYITIEAQVWPKHPDDIHKGTHHRNHRTLVICYRESWKELKYVKTRNYIYDEK